MHSRLHLIIYEYILYFRLCHGIIYCSQVANKNQEIIHANYEDKFLHKMQRVKNYKKMLGVTPEILKEISNSLI